MPGPESRTWSLGGPATEDRPSISRSSKMTTAMSSPTKPPSFNGFSRWLAARLDRAEMSAERYETLKGAARTARDEFVESRRPFAAKPATGRIEALYLLAAADKSDASL